MLFALPLLVAAPMIIHHSVQAAGLGKWLMGRPLPKGSARPDDAVLLSAPVPIYMTYFTAIETKAGVGFLTDVYGRDTL